MIKIAINGYGRIGRNVLRALYESGRDKTIKIVAINELPITPKTLFREFVAAGLIGEGAGEEQRHV